MGVKIFVSGLASEKAASIAQVSSRLPRTTTGKSSREEGVLDLMDAVAVVPFLMGSGSVVSRGVTGPGFDIVESEIDANGSQAKRKEIVNFFNYVSPSQKNIKDIFGPLAKVYTTAFAFRVFGHSAWEIIWDKEGGRPLGFDFIPGVIRPNVEADGKFKRPAYVQRLRVGGTETKSEFNNPDDIIFFGVPDFSGNIYMAELLSLAEYTLPSEIYAAVAYRSLHENRDAPYSGFWYTPQDIDDDTFDRFLAMVQSRYTGSANYGRNPIVMKGEGGFKSLSIQRDDAPYIEGRALNRDEISAASGVPSAKYGVGDSGVDLRELRREFYESTLRPVMSLMEETIYRQVCIKLFGAPEWKFKFHRPDFTTAVEDASIELRRIQWGQWSPNEARASRGEAPRDGGDYYLVPKNMDVVGPDGKPGRPENQPVDDNEGDMLPSEEDPVPPTQPPEPVGTDESSMLDPLRKWRRFELRVATGKRFKREFAAPLVPGDLRNFINDSLLDIEDDPDAVAQLFDDVIDIVVGS